MKRSILLAFIFLLLYSCGNRAKEKARYSVFKGNTMGSTYEIAIDTLLDLKQNIEYKLGFFSYLLSTYDQNSIISKFNNGITLSSDDSISYHRSEHIFQRLDSISRLVNEASGGCFDPGISELINYWGFGEKRKNPEEADTALITKLRSQSYGFLIKFKGRIPDKINPKQNLNFNAIAPGYAADILAEMFDSVYHIKNYYINISGEIRAKGNNGTDSYWPIKIEKPMFNGLKPVEYCTVPLKNYSLATSGNYRQFFIKDGQRYGHSIDPRTGYPSRNPMLSATILAPTAIEADAFATACMVLGPEDAIKMVEKDPRLKAFLIFEKEGQMTHWASSNLSYEMKKNK